MRTQIARRAWESTLGSSRLQAVVALFAVAMSLTGCGAIRGIFKAGFWIGVVLAVFAIIGVLGLTRMFSRR